MDGSALQGFTAFYMICARQQIVHGSELLNPSSFMSRKQLVEIEEDLRGQVTHPPGDQDALLWLLSTDYHMQLLGREAGRFHLAIQLLSSTGRSIIRNQPASFLLMYSFYQNLHPETSFRYAGFGQWKCERIAK